MNCLKKIVIILPYSIMVVMGYFFVNHFQINDANSNPVFGFKYTEDMLEKDGSYVFYDGNGEKKVISVSQNKIESKMLNDSILNIGTFYNDSIKLRVVLKDTIKSEQTSYFTNSNIFVVSDIEGNFKVFTKFLLKNKIIDENFNWIFGKGHLVCNGDFFDRGNDVTACLWLIYKLEKEAEKKGGKVHFVLGNHEEMNLRGDVKYVHLKYKALAAQLKIPYKELYGRESELGRWLRTKNSVLKINDILFVHGGLSTKLIYDKYTLEEINQLTQNYIGEDKNYLKFINYRASVIFDTEGPMWYRGYCGSKYTDISQEDIESILNYYKASHIVVGHTVVEEVQALFNNKVILIDVVSKDDPRRKDDSNTAISCEGLYIENKEFYRVFSDGGKKLLFRKIE